MDYENSENPQVEYILQRRKDLIENWSRQVLPAPTQPVGFYRYAVGVKTKPWLSLNGAIIHFSTNGTSAPKIRHCSIQTEVLLQEKDGNIIGDIFKIKYPTLFAAINSK